MKIIQMFFFIIIVSHNLFGQFQIEWEKTWDNSVYQNDIARLVELDSESNIIVVGEALSGSYSNDLDIGIVKYSSDGIELWSTIFDLGAYDRPIGLYTDTEDNIIIGIVGVESAYEPDFILVKFDKDGNQLFAKKVWLNNPSTDKNVTGSADKMHLDNYNNLIIGGVSANYVWQVRMDFLGNVSSSHIEEVIYAEYTNGSTTYLDASTSELSIGVRYGRSTSVTYGIIIQKNDGSIKWIADFYTRLTTNDVWFTGIMRSANGNTYISLYDSDFDFTIREFRSVPHLIKLDNDGQVLWDDTLKAKTGNMYVSIFNDMKFDINENIVVTGAIDSKYFTAKYSSAGERFLFEQDTTLVEGKIVEPFGNGYFYTFVIDDRGNQNIIKYNDLGVELDRIELLGVNAYSPLLFYDVKLDESNNIYVVGGKNMSTNKNDFLTLKINDLTTSVDKITSIKEFSLSQNYPNPFNPTTVIEFALPVNGNVSLKVFNSLGEEVATLVNKELNAGYHSANFNANQLSTGVYFYRISSGNFTQTNKMLLVK